jgi:hypothetical protein
MEKITKKQYEFAIAMVEELLPPIDEILRPTIKRQWN